MRKKALFFDTGFHERFHQIFYKKIRQRKRILYFSKAACRYIWNRPIRITLCPVVKWVYNKIQNDKHNWILIFWAIVRYGYADWRLSVTRFNTSRRKTNTYQCGGTTARTGSKKIHKILYYNLLTSEKLNAHLAKINRQAEEMFSWMVKQMAEREGVTEQLKSENQMEWVDRINNIRNRAEEIVKSELIYN